MSADLATRAPVAATRPPTAPRAFVRDTGPVDVGVVVVTHDSADDVDGVLGSLRDQLRPGLSVRVVVVDNASHDASVARARAHADVVVLEAGGNLGYAAAINRARGPAGPSDALLVLNPDVRLLPGALDAMLDRLGRPGVGAVAPLIVDADGAAYPSVRRDPSPTRTAGDALLGRRLPGRSARLAETDRDPRAYEHAHPVDWATGAALLVRADVHDVVGDWDERFFLYSEETDFCRRVRESGSQVWFEPAARVTHEGGGSGTSPALTALLTVNRVRYVRKVAPPAAAAAVAAAALAGAVLRLPDPGHRMAAAALVSRTHRARLPGPTRSPATAASASPTTRPCVVVPAHNEAAVIDRTLRPLAPLAAAGDLELVVVVNGADDATAERARTHPGVTVLEIAEAAKPAALNAGDDVARGWPRVYLDADVELGPEALRATVAALARDGLLAARPTAAYDTTGATWTVRCFYRARGRMALLHGSLWGAGVYALTRAGHERLGRFPPLTGDDLWVDSLFAPGEKAVLDTATVRVRTPRTTASLVAVLRRTYRGNAEVARLSPSATSTARTVRALVGTVRGPRSAMDASVYAALVVAARRRPGGRGPSHPAWERDDSSRS